VGDEDLAICLQTGIRAVQTTPLVSRSGQLVGMISTHWKEPHSPSDRDLRLFDILARQAADLIERRRAEQALAESEAKLREDDRRKDEFLAMLAHELRNPLAPIVNAVQLLGRPADERLQQHARGVIERQAARLTRLVDDLLEVSRIKSGRIQIHREHIALGGVIERAVETVRPLIQERRHNLSLHVSDEPLWLFADATRLEQILVNLLNNAAKYTDEGGSIELTADSSRGEAVVRVRDNGIGIEPELLSRIFELFTQAERSLDRAGGGLGIGLALVRKLVELHGGGVIVRSELGRGSEFIVRLPLADPTPALKTERSSERAVSTEQCLRALVVDDNIDAAQSFGMLLEAAGHEVQLAHDGEAALTLADAQAPHVIFLDIGLPKIDGYEIARRLRENSAHRAARLVAMTGYGQRADRERAQAAGFDHYLVKPAAFSSIESILASVVEEQRS
jgi:signal transduction histidine kinase/ActR/RegA family two-component response regulator